MNYYSLSIILFEKKHSFFCNTEYQSNFTVSSKPHLLGSMCDCIRNVFRIVLLPNQQFVYKITHAAQISEAKSNAD